MITAGSARSLKIGSQSAERNLVMIDSPLSAGISAETNTFHADPGKSYPLFYNEQSFSCVAIIHFDIYNKSDLPLFASF